MTDDVTSTTARPDRSKLNFAARVEIIRRVRTWQGTKDEIYRRLGLEFGVSHITVRRAYLGALPPRSTRVDLLVSVANWLIAMPTSVGATERAQAVAYAEQLRALANIVR
jgi:hypothetical protein